MRTTIRHGVAADAATLAEFAARTFADTFAADNRPEDLALHLARSYGPAQQGAELVDPAVTTLLAEVGDELVGYAQLRAGRAPGCVAGDAPLELWRFYVARAWHGQGLARALMTQVDEAARQRGAGTLWLGVWERNERAKAFYRKAGFIDVGSHTFLLGRDPQTDRIMACPVALGTPFTTAALLGSRRMKYNDLLALTSILSVILLSLHISQDIVFGLDRAGLNHLVGIAILLVIACGALLLRDRALGKVIMLLGGLMALAMLPLHMRHGLKPEFLQRSGALLFIWTIYVLGVNGALSIILAVLALRERRKREV